MHRQEPLLPDTAERKRFRRNLLAWYARHARDLPWRRTTDPYRIWISEIMLQQTTVKAVVGYYERFLREFPTIEVLAAAPEEHVLRQWEGLGYYSRARNIHRAAGVIIGEHSGRFPQEVDALRRLPGIGRYTAGAIASFAFDRPAPIVEANTQRLYSRLLSYAGDVRSADGQRLLWEFAESLVPRKSPGRFNQSLMEVGATVCTPTDPRCPECPLMKECAAFRQGLQNEIPTAAARPEITELTEAAVAIRSQDSILLYRRPAGERWAGLWDFPRYAIDAESIVPATDSKSSRSNGHQRNGAKPSNNTIAVSTRRELRRLIRDQTALGVEIGPIFSEMKHSVTRYRIRLVCILAEHQTGTIDETREMRWVQPGDFEGFPLSTTGRKLANLLQKRHLGLHPRSAGRS